MDGLGGEKERWNNALDEAEKRFETIVPDCLLGSAIIAYLGPYIQVYRNQIVRKWRQELKRNGLRTTKNFSLEDVVGDQVLIRQWHMTGLPADSFSI